MTIIAVLNQKGGVGKTTTAVTLASGLARMGFKILLVDLDTQGNVADCLGLTPGDDLRRLLSPDLRLPLSEVVQITSKENLSVIRSDRTTAELKQVLAGVTMKEFALADALANALYDAILLDCAPSKDVLASAALVAADYLLIPTQLDKLAINGVRDALNSLIQLNRIGRCQLAGIIPTFYERKTTEAHLQLTHLALNFGNNVLPQIPLDARCKVAARFGKTLWEYAPKSRALIGYRDGNQRVGGYVQVLDRVKDLL